MHPKTLKHNPVFQETETFSRKHDHGPKTLLKLLQEFQYLEEYANANNVTMGASDPTAKITEFEVCAFL
jgi:hypothetical protein